jgi:uncharacterized protein (DUF362 family)
MKKNLKRLLFPIIGFSSLFWFLLRVIPKPSRAAYPCMRAAAPIASSFIVYLLGLFSTVFVFRRARKYLHEAKYVLFTVALLTGVTLALITTLHSNDKVYAVLQAPPDGPNNPMGVGTGIFPGRVVWIHNPDATDENCANSRNDYWYQDDNTDQSVVSSMLSQSLQKLTGTDSDAAAWDAIFHYYNQKRGRGDVGYKTGEKIAIKINLNGTGNGRTPDPNINTSPQICYAVLNQLVNVVGVAQADIGMGDPSHSGFWSAMTNKCKPTFPNVKYWGQGSGLTPTPASKDEVIFSADGEVADVLPQVYLDATYLINIPVFKKHHRAGISLCCKNHFGSTAPYYGGAWQWHYSLPSPDATGDAVNGEYGVYRCFVDIMGHEDLGGKTILYLVDGIWGSTNWGHPPVKWRMAPFNNDWPSSLFVSQDPVAVESVGFDFLYYEFDENHPTEGSPATSEKGPFPHFAGTDDYLHQAADSKNWPAGITYDPENDGVPLPASMGAHEHWNNAIDKQYSRNLGLDKGIELYTIEGSSIVEKPGQDREAIVRDYTLSQNYPNPFNPDTQIQYWLSRPSYVTLTVFQVNGQQVCTLYDGYQQGGTHLQKWDGRLENGLAAPSGVYMYRITVQNDAGTSQQACKMVLSR